jgi:hypothetical protein
VILGLLVGCGVPPADSAIEDVTCPPAGPYGREVGDPAEDVAMADCDGAPVSIHGLCGRPALVVNWYGWCPTCEDNAGLARQLADAHPDLAVAIVLDEDPLAAPVDPEFCAAYADAKPSAAALWADPEGAFEVYGTTDLVLVLDRAGTVSFVRNTATEAAITAAVDAVLE